VLEERLRARPESLLTHYHASSVAAFLAGPSNNGLHAANALAALFIATGQDVASVGESSAGVVHAEPSADGGGLYLSVTLPSLIVATYGGGTGLPTQRECLEVMGCYGTGRVNAFAEIVTSVVLAGELSLAAAIAANEWVEAHERLGRNR
jgi:hydroxymethylglutaryl-CoA reductase (NADPH)